MNFLDKTGLIYVWSKIKALLNNKVDKITGKGLSTNDYTTSEKNKLANLPTNPVTTESDPTVPSHIKSITEENISSWNGKAEKSDIPNTSNFATKDKYGDTAISLGRRTDAGSTGTNSVATGDRTQANGNYSVAMGSLAQANAMAAVALGREVRANGSYSVALGEGAITKNTGEVAVGKWNKEDTTGKVLHSVGNGTSSSSRSNAHTVENDGTAWFQGDVYTGSTSGTNKDAGSVRLARLNEIPKISSGTQDLESGVSTLPTGEIYIVYEE